jgi:UDP-3-O-[3-hydroxymyristoyl] glucosamine N-acyltransferase
MNGPTLLLILFAIGALVAIGAGSVIGSATLIAAGAVFALVGAILAARHRGEA